MNKNSLELYMGNIYDIPLITREDEATLAARIAQGDEEARHKLIQSNLRLVVKIAHDFKNKGLPFEDLISEGNIGLMKAADKFDPSKGAKFSSYAAWWIKQSMRNALAFQSRTVRIPTQSVVKIYKLKQLTREMTEELKREPTDEELAQRMEIPVRKVNTLRKSMVKTFSLQDSIKCGEDSIFQEIIPDENIVSPDNIVETSEIQDNLKIMVKLLDDREQFILIHRFGLNGSPPKTLEEISVDLGRTRERVRQLQNRALKKLKKLIDDDQLDLTAIAAAMTN